MKKIYFFILLVTSIIELPAQNFEWASQFSGVGNNQGRGITVDKNGNVYSVSNFTDTIDADPGPGVFNLSVNGGDILISKLDGSGGFQWAKCIGLGKVYEIEVDDSNNVYIIGALFGDTVDLDPGPGIYMTISYSLSDLFVLKLDSSGNFIWGHRMLGTEGCHGRSIAIDMDYIYITGSFSQEVDMDPGPGVLNLVSNGINDVFVLKLDLNGNFIWAKSVGGTNNDWGESIKVDNSGNIYYSGTFVYTVDFDPGPGVFNLGSSGSGHEAFISKLDASGNFIWAVSITGGNIHNVSMAIDTNVNIFITGFYGGTIDADPGASIYSLTSNINGNWDFYIVKLDSTGNFSWAGSIGSTDMEESYGITVDSKGDFYITGMFLGIVDFDPGPGVYNLTSGMTYNSVFKRDIFLCKFNNTGSLQYVINLGGKSGVGDIGFGVFIDKLGNIYNIGDFRDTVDFDPGLGIYNLIGTPSLNQSPDIYVMKLSQCFMPIVSNISSTATNYNFPNCNGSVSITPTGGTPPYTISWSSGTTTNLCQGWYTITIVDANECSYIDSVYVPFVTGIEELNAAGISIYPNPAKDILIIKSEKEIGEIKIYDVVGKLIYHELIKNSNAEIDVKEFDAGIYFVEAEYYRGKFVKW